MKKVLTMTVGLLTVIALFAVVAVARNGDGDEDAARTEAAVAAVAEAAVADHDDGDEDDEGSDDDGDVGVEDADEDDREEDEEGADEDDARHRWWDKDKDDREGDEDDDGRRGSAKEGWLPRERIPDIKAWFADQGPDWEDSFGSPADLLDALVADGVMTREQADALAARMEAEAERELGKLAEMGIISQEQIPDIVDWLETQDATLKQGLENPAGLLAAMVEDEIITQEQADAITELLIEYEGKEKRKHHRGGGDMLFGKLAAEGIISEDQLPAITAWIMEQEPDLAESLENPEEMLTAMVEDEIITQEQADAITELLIEYEGKEKRKHHRGGGDMLFGKLAAEGIISEDQLPAITAWIMEQGDDQAESFENPEEMLAAMVEDDIITQEQADAITELFAQYEEMKSDDDGSEHEETKSEAAASLRTEA